MTASFDNLFLGLKDLAVAGLISVDELLNSALPRLAEQALAFEREMAQLAPMPGTGNTRPSARPKAEPMAEQYKPYAIAYQNQLKLPKNRFGEACVAMRLAALCVHYDKYLDGNADLANELILLKADGARAIMACYRWYLNQYPQFAETWHPDHAKLIDELIGQPLGIKQICEIPEPKPLSRMSFIAEAVKQEKIARDVAKRPEVQNLPSIIELYEQTDLEGLVREYYTLSDAEWAEAEGRIINKLLGPVWQFAMPMQGLDNPFYSPIVYYKAYLKYKQDGIKGTWEKDVDLSKPWQVDELIDVWVPNRYWELAEEEPNGGWAKGHRNHAMECIALLNEFIEDIANNIKYTNFFGK